MAAKVKTWHEKATSKAIMLKVNRKKNPVSSLVQLAQEFGAPVHGPYPSSYKSGYRASSGFSYSSYTRGSGRTASRAFRDHVRKTVGDTTYRQIRDGSKVTW